MKRWRWFLLMGLVLGSLGVGVQLSWGHVFMKGWKKWFKEQQKEQLRKALAPDPPPPPDHAERARSAVATLKEMCRYMSQEHVDALEFARRFGTVTEALDSGEVFFRPHEPLLRDHSAEPLDADILTGPEFYAVSLNPDREHLLTIADLEPTFGTPYASNPTEYFVYLWFPWDPEDGDRMRCRLMARVQHGEEGGYDDKTNRLQPWVDRTTVHLDDFELERGVVEDKFGTLGPEPVPLLEGRPSLDQARR